MANICNWNVTSVGWKELKRVFTIQAKSPLSLSSAAFEFHPIQTDTRERWMFSITIRPYTPAHPPVGLRAVLDTLWWKHRCQRPYQIETLLYAIVHWPTCVWACCHTMEHTDLTWVTRDNAVGIPTRLRTGQSWVRNSVGGGALEISSSSECPDQIWGSLGLRFKGHRGSFPRVKPPLRVISDAVHLFPLYTCIVGTSTSNFYLSF